LRQNNLKYKKITVDKVVELDRHKANREHFLAGSGVLDIEKRGNKYEHQTPIPTGKFYLRFQHVSLGQLMEREI
jgi:hypothetical protein